MRHNLLDSCMSYSTCGIVLAIEEIDWMTVGAVVLLVARLVKDLPDSYDSVKGRIARYKLKRDIKNGKEDTK